MEIANLVKKRWYYMRRIILAGLIALLIVGTALGGYAIAGSDSKVGEPSCDSINPDGTYGCSYSCGYCLSQKCNAAGSCC